MFPYRLSILAAALGVLLMWPPTRADEARLAVAANFAPVVENLEPAFESATSHTIVASLGPTRPRQQPDAGLSVRGDGQRGAGLRRSVAVARLAQAGRQPLAPGLEAFAQVKSVAVVE